MSKNSKQDFLDTVKTEDQGGIANIICPACGASMSLKNTATFDMILSVNTRKAVNEIIRSFRSFIKNNEDLLRSINLYGVHKGGVKDAYPFIKYRDVDDEGVYNTKGMGIAKFYLSSPDIFGIAKKTSSVINLKDLNHMLEAKNGSDPQIESLISSIIFGFEPHPVIGPVLDLLLDQENIKTWIDKIKMGGGSNADIRSETVEGIIKKVSPYYYEYLSTILKYVENGLSSPKDYKLHEKYTNERSEIKNRIIRCYQVIAILLGHETIEKKQDDIIPFLEKDIPFDFPRLVRISPVILEKMMTSHSIVSSPAFGISTSYKDLLSENNVESITIEEKELADDLTEQLEGIIKQYSFMPDDLKSFVEFACKGPAATIPVFEAYQENENPNEEESERSSSERVVDKIESYSYTQCGWYPKESSTHPIVFIGSTGTGKSSVMMAGLTTLMSAAGKLGMSVRPTTSDDVNLINWYSTQFFKGIMPKATETNSRFSIELTFVSATNPEQRTNFVFTDIPGEMIARSLETKGTDPVVINLLKYTDTIIFFFDLATEPYFFNVVEKGRIKGQWEKLIEHVNYLRKKEKRGTTNQMFLLNKLIEDIRSLRKKEEIEKMRFICVIPKSDFFIGENDTKKFLYGFYKGLSDKKIIDDSQLSSEEEEDFASKRSVGAAAFEKDRTDLINKQKDVINIIKEEALIALSHISDSLSPDDPTLISETDQEVLQGKISTELIKVIETTFNKGEVYFLPVSAQGKSKIPNGKNKHVELGNPPNQKLAEYVFIIPVVSKLIQQRDKD